jgi:hypothetical protein
MEFSWFEDWFGDNGITLGTWLGYTPPASRYIIFTHSNVDKLQ